MEKHTSSTQQSALSLFLWGLASAFASSMPDVAVQTPGTMKPISRHTQTDGDCDAEQIAATAVAGRCGSRATQTVWRKHYYCDGSRTGRPRKGFRSSGTSSRTRVGPDGVEESWSDGGEFILLQGGKASIGIQKGPPRYPGVQSERIAQWPRTPSGSEAESDTTRSLAAMHPETFPSSSPVALVPDYLPSISFQEFTPGAQAHSSGGLCNSISTQMFY